MDYSKKIEFYKRRQFGDKLNMVIVFLRQNSRSYFKVHLFITAPLLMVTNLLMTQIGFGFYDFMNMQDTMMDDTTFISEMLKMYGIVFLTYLLMGTLMPGVTYGYMKVYEKEPLDSISANQVFQNAMRHFPFLFGNLLLVGIISIVGIFFFVIPGVYLGVVLSLCAPIIMFEEKDPISAIGRAFTLIKEHWWSTLGLIVVSAILGGLINYIFSIPQMIVYGIMAFNTASGTQVMDPPAYINVINVVFAALNTIGSIISYSIIYLALSFQYFNIIERRESRGLMRRIDHMDNDTPTEEEETY